METDKKRILLIDDEETFTNALKFYLEKTGRFAVRTEHRGDQGLATAKLFKPDLILLDVIMPDMDGGSVASQFREDPELQRVPVIFLTAAVSRDEAITRSGMIGGQMFIPKPVSAKEVLACVEQHLDNGADIKTTSA